MAAGFSTTGQITDFLGQRLAIGPAPIGRSAGEEHPRAAGRRDPQSRFSCAAPAESITATTGCWKHNRDAARLMRRNLVPRECRRRTFRSFRSHASMATPPVWCAVRPHNSLEIADDRKIVARCLSALRFFHRDRRKPKPAWRRSTPMTAARPRAASGPIPVRSPPRIARCRSAPWSRSPTRKTAAPSLVRINDRGPFMRGRIIDLTPAAAQQLGFGGLAPVILSSM